MSKGSRMIMEMQVKTTKSSLHTFRCDRVRKEEPGVGEDVEGLAFTTTGMARP